MTPGPGLRIVSATSSKAWFRHCFSCGWRVALITITLSIVGHRIPAAAMIGRFTR
jgi:hypothetical protein